jgi:hypothetical protein
MEASSTPRANFEVLARLQGRRVLLVGEVESVADQVLTLVTSDKGRVSVNYSGSGEPITSKFVEIVGTVVDSRTVTEESHTNFGDNFGTSARGCNGRGKGKGEGLVLRARAEPPAPRHHLTPSAAAPPLPQT